MNELALAIYEAEASYEIDSYTRDSLLQATYENAINPLQKFVKRIRDVKDTKPDEYDGPEEVKKYIDKNADDLINAAKLIEKEPEKLRRNEIITAVGVVLGYLGTVASVAIADAMGAVFVVPIVLAILTVVLTLTYCIITWVRTNDDVKVSNDLAKIRSAFIKLNKNKLPDSYKRKIDKVITAIDDAETEISARLKVQKESVFDDIYESGYYDDDSYLYAEGANIDLLKQKREIRKRFKEDMKDITRSVQNNDLKKASKQIDELVKVLEDALDDLENKDYTVVSAVISWFIGPMTGNFGRWLISTALAIPTLNLSKFVESVQVIIEAWDSVMKRRDLKGSIDVSDVNLIKSAIRATYKKYIKRLKELKTHFGEAEKVAKESVLEDIYEAELNGEITPEERQSLIDYMNI